MKKFIVSIVIVCMSTPLLAETTTDGPGWNSSVCGSEEDFANNLNRLNEQILCRNAGLSQCAALIGAAGAGSIAAVRAARLSSALSADRAIMCPLGTGIERPTFTDPMYAILGEILLPTAQARPQRACMRQSEAAARRVQGYLESSQRQLMAARDRERAALTRALDQPTTTARDLFRQAPSTPERLTDYVTEMRGLLSDPNTTFANPSYRASALEYLDHMGRQTDGIPASRWSDMREGLFGRIGDDFWTMERQASERYAARIDDASRARLAEVRDILLTRGPDSAPGAFSPDAQRRLAAFRQQNPSLAPLINEAIEARTAYSLASHQSDRYAAALREMSSPTAMRRLADNPRELERIIGGLRHFDFEGSRDQRFFVSAAMGNVTIYDERNRRHVSAGLRPNAQTWQGPGLGRPNPALSAMVANGSTLARRSLGVGMAALTVATGGTAMAAEVALTPTRLGCGTVRSQYVSSDQGGCGNDYHLDSPNTQRFLTLPPEMQMAEAMEFPGDICEMVNNLASELSGPESYQASCDGGDGFTITSRGRRGATDFRLRARYGSNPGEIGQVNLSGQQTFAHGGMRSLRFQGDEVSEVLIPVGGGAWLAAMQADPEAAIDFENPEAYTRHTGTSLLQGESAEGRETAASLALLADHAVMTSEVSACCTGQGAPSAERCQAYGISGDGATSPRAPGSRAQQ
jgi:hypothetical protein